MTATVTPQASPDHAHGGDGRLVYDARCWWCRQTTAQSRPAVGHLDNTLPAAHQAGRS
jgi:cytochrome c5